MRKVMVVLLLVLALAAPVAASRTWSHRLIDNGNFECGWSPSIALLYGVQPVISNYDGSSQWAPSPNRRAVYETAFGWVNWSGAAGYVAGDGKDLVVSYGSPMTYGKDGNFYSIATDPLRPVTINGGEGPAWPQVEQSYTWGAVDADARGTIYMGVGDSIAACVDGSWTQKMLIAPDSYVSDLSVSLYGDIAVSCWMNSQPGTNLVKWFDYKRGWSAMTMYSPGYDYVQPDLKWDSLGNLGIAYSPDGMNLKFDYLNSNTGVWTSEVVGHSALPGYFTGVALEYDRFGNPVIASGKDLYYDPQAVVPEPSSLALLAMGASCFGLGRRRLLKRKHKD